MKRKKNKKLFQLAIKTRDHPDTMKDYQQQQQKDIQ